MQYSKAEGSGVRRTKTARSGMAVTGNSSMEDTSMLWPASEAGAGHRAESFVPSPKASGEAASAG